MQNENPYLDLTTYNEVYQELVYQRNETIRWLDEHGLLNRNRHVDKADEDEWTRHRTAVVYRPLFHQSVLALLDRLYSHDTIEAVYDFNAVELADWSDTEANRLERELQQLQLILGKLETRYRLQYRPVFEYRAEECTLYQSSIKIFSCGQSTLRHRLLVTLFSDPQHLWSNDDIEQYFVDHFNYTSGDLTDRNIEKAAKDVQKDVAAKTAISDLLVVSNSSVRINSKYLA